MIRHYTVVVPATPVGRAAIYGATEELQHFGPSAAGVKAALPIAGGLWGAPTQSNNNLCAWGVWATMDNGGLLAALQQAAAGVGGQVFTWDDSNEQFGAYVTRWKTGVAWVDAPFGTAVGVPISAVGKV